jgi:hypothetical protein
MNLKTTLLAALGALFIAAPAVQAQPGHHSYRHSHYRHYYRHDRGCGFYRRGEYGLFGHYRNRLTFGCR